MFSSLRASAETTPAVSKGTQNYACPASPRSVAIDINNYEDEINEEIMKLISRKQFLNIELLNLPSRKFGFRK